MLIVALVLAVIGLAALVTAVVTSNELVAWVCIGASALGVLLLIVDAIRERAQRRVSVAPATGETVTVEPTAVIAAQTAVIGSAGATEVIEAVEDAADEEEDEVVDEVADFESELDAEIATEDHPEEVVHDEPDYDIPTDDEQDFPVPAEVAAIHIVDEQSLDEESLEDESLVEEILGEPTEADAERDEQ